MALAVSGAEPIHQNDWRERFYAMLSDWRFLPGGRTLAGAGTSHRVTQFNCLALRPVQASVGVVPLQAVGVAERGLHAGAARRRLAARHLQQPPVGGGTEGQAVFFDVEDAACRQYQALHGPDAPWPKHFVQAIEVSAEDQLNLMAAVQSCVEGAIAKTVYLPKSASEQDVGRVLQQAWELGLKGCAIDRLGRVGPI